MSVLARLFSYATKPQTLGEGLKRVVKAAGNGRSGELVRQTVNVGTKNATTRLKYKTDYPILDIDAKRIATREYSNGVNICYGDVSQSFHTDKNNWFTLGVMGDLLGVYKGKNLFAGRHAITLSDFNNKLHCYKHTYLKGTPMREVDKIFGQETDATFKALM